VKTQGLALTGCAWQCSCWRYCFESGDYLQGEILRPLVERRRRWCTILLGGVAFGESVVRPSYFFARWPVVAVSVQFSLNSTRGNWAGLKLMKILMKINEFRWGFCWFPQFNLEPCVNNWRPHLSPVGHKVLIAWHGGEIKTAYIFRCRQGNQRTLWIRINIFIFSPGNQGNFSLSSWCGSPNWSYVVRHLCILSRCAWFFFSLLKGLFFLFQGRCTKSLGGNIPPNCIHCCMQSYSFLLQIFKFLYSLRFKIIAKKKMYLDMWIHPFLSNYFESEGVQQSL
jgi:hypothetical protein